MTVTLAELKYQSPKEGMYVTEATIGATFRSDVQNANRRYSGRYGASLDQRFGMAPNQETNTKLISDVLSDARVSIGQFNDPYVSIEFDGKGGRTTVDCRFDPPQDLLGTPTETPLVTRSVRSRVGSRQT